MAVKPLKYYQSLFGLFSVVAFVTLIISSLLIYKSILLNKYDVVFGGLVLLWVGSFILSVGWRYILVDFENQVVVKGGVSVLPVCNTVYPFERFNRVTVGMRLRRVGNEHHSEMRAFYNVQVQGKGICLFLKEFSSYDRSRQLALALSGSLGVKLVDCSQVQTKEREAREKKSASASKSRPLIKGKYRPMLNKSAKPASKKIVTKPIPKKKTVESGKQGDVKRPSLMRSECYYDSESFTLDIPENKNHGIYTTLLGGAGVIAVQLTFAGFMAGDRLAKIPVSFIVLIVSVAAVVGGMIILPLLNKAKARISIRMDRSNLTHSFKSIFSKDIVMRCADIREISIEDNEFQIKRERESIDSRELGGKWWYDRSNKQEAWLAVRTSFQSIEIGRGFNRRELEFIEHGMKSMLPSHE